MPTRRTRVAHARVVAGPLELEHLELGGDHLLAGDCWICQRGIASARGAWAENRAAILAGWRYPFPCFGQIIFDRVPLPDAEPAQAHERLIFAMLQTEYR